MALITTNADGEIEMIFIVPESRLDTLAPDVRASISRCEAQYHRGNFYVRIPAGEYGRWAEQPGKEQSKMTRSEWFAEGERLFGTDIEQWRFVCPSCGHVASVQDWMDADAPEGAVAFSCIGRYLPKCNEAFGGMGSGPCNYTGGGLFRLNPVDVEGRLTFAFAQGVPNR